MQKDLVDERAWYTQDEFQKGMTLAQLAPGPLAAQMSIYFGWCERGWIGAFFTGLCFVAPSFLMVLVIGALYVKFGSLPWIRNAFLGIAPMVVAIVIFGVKKLATKNLKKDPALWIIALGNAALTFLTRQENLWVILLSGTLYLLSKNFIKPSANAGMAVFAPFSLLQGIHGEATRSELEKLFLFFLKSGAFVFGSGLAIVPFLRGGVVSEFHWLTEAVGVTK
jgi:chromate transporter